MAKDRCRIVVLISGNGSNLQAIIDAIAVQQIEAQVVAVVSNRADAYGLQRAQTAGIPTRVISNADYQDREIYDQALMACIDEFKPDLIVLAGFMRILSDGLVQHYLGRMLNIHPSLLPRHKGLHTHRRVLEAGEQEHGATVHFVSPELDSGPIVLQGKTRIQPSDNEQQLAQRVHEIEHKIYPQAIRWFAEGRLSLADNTVHLDNIPIRQYEQLSTDS